MKASIYPFWGRRYLGRHKREGGVVGNFSYRLTTDSNCKEAREASMSLTPEGHSGY